MLICCAALVTTGWASQTGLAQDVVLREGQTRWFFDGGVRVGQTIRCVAGSAEVAAEVPEVEPGASTFTSAFTKTTSGKALSVQIERQPSGATRIACGPQNSPQRRPATLPYVIGPNGVGLIRGPNRLDRLTHLFGAPSSLRTGHVPGGRCTARWRAIGLVVTFGRAACDRDAVLVRALVSGKAWSSLNGTHVGDHLAQMRWQQPGAKVLSSTRGSSVWLLGSARPPRRSSLFATVSSNGRISSFLLAPRR